MRTATALLAMLIALAGAGGWLAGRSAGERWRAAQATGDRESAGHAAGERWRTEVQWPEATPQRERRPAPFDLVVEYDPPPARVPGVENRAPPAPPPAVVDSDPVTRSAQAPASPEPSVMQRLLLLQQRMGQEP